MLINVLPNSDFLLWPGTKGINLNRTCDKLQDLKSFYSVRKQAAFGDATTGFPVKWCLRNERRNSILMTLHYPDLGSASDWSCRLWNLLQPIRNTTQIWIVTRHQYGISVLVSQTWFCRETVGGVAKCCLFSKARVFKDSNLSWNCHVKCKI